MRRKVARARYQFDDDGEHYKVWVKHAAVWFIGFCCGIMAAYLVS